MTELVTKPILYQCPICDSGYTTMEEAVACRDQPCDWSGWKAGDLCLIPGGRVSTEPEDPMWVAFTQPADLSSDSHFDHKPSWHLWWVITCLHLHDRDKHRAIVTVLTRPNHHDILGWNPANGYGHYQMFRPGKPLSEQTVTEYHNTYYWDMLHEQIMAAVPSSELLGRSKSFIGRISRNLL